MPQKAIRRDNDADSHCQGGSKMFSRKGRFAPADCDHPKVVTVRNAGIERTVCETCGHVGIRALEGLSGSVDRSRFERPVERPR